MFALYYNPLDSAAKLLKWLRSIGMPVAHNGKITCMDDDGVGKSCMDDRVGAIGRAISARRKSSDMHLDTIVGGSTTSVAGRRSTLVLIVRFTLHARQAPGNFGKRPLPQNRGSNARRIDGRFATVPRPDCLLRRRSVMTLTYCFPFLAPSVLAAVEAARLADRHPTHLCMLLPSRQPSLLH